MKFSNYFHIIILICNIKTINNHSSDQGELDEAFNCDHESRQIDDNLQMEDDKQRPQHQRRIIIELFDNQLRNHVIFTNP